MSPVKAEKSQLDQQLIGRVKDIFTNQIPFNKALGLELTTDDPGLTRIRIQMRDELIGNFLQESLHGGVISTLLDVMGGLTAFLDIVRKSGDRPTEEQLRRLSTFGTVDLRVDYLRPGRGKYFEASGSVLRTGNKVAVTRMELHNDEGVLIAVGTGTYLIS
ncbi:thioesterase family protein [bacterium]|nr:thioesterase family protein [bacterium]